MKVESLLPYQKPVNGLNECVTSKAKNMNKMWSENSEQKSMFLFCLKDLNLLTNLIYKIMIVPMERRMLLELTSIWSCCCSITPKTLESTLLNQNLIFPSLVLFISATVHYPCKVSCITAQDCSDLLHSTFYFCEALSGINLLLKWFRHVSGFFFPQRLCLIFS